MMDGLLDSQTLAKKLGVPARTLVQWAYRRKGPVYVRIGRYRRYDPRDVEAWLREQRRGGPNAPAA